MHAHMHLLVLLGLDLVLEVLVGQPAKSSLLNDIVNYNAGIYAIVHTAPHT